MIHSQESMKTSTSKGRNICHTPASVHGIYFKPFEADLFMASVSLSLSILFAKVAMSDALPRIHEDLSLEGQKQVSHTSECTWHLFHAVRGQPIHGKYQFHSPISSFASNCKNRQQIQLLFANFNMNNKHMYDNKNNIA